MLRLIRRGQDAAMCRRARAIADRFSSRRVAGILATLIHELKDS